MNLSQEELDQILEDLQTTKLQLQEGMDILDGGITSKNMASFRNTYVINAQDSLDASYPFYTHFNIINEMVEIVSVKLSFWILNYRAYSTAASSGGAVSSASGGGETPTSSGGGGQTTSATSSASGGGSTESSGASSDDKITTYIPTAVTAYAGGYLIDTYSWDNLPLMVHTHQVVLPNHTHPNHTHTVVNHTHTVTVAAHTHTGGAHTHNITYGIFEEVTSPMIKFYVSNDNGISYSDVFGGYVIDQSSVDITSLLSKSGSKMVKFTSDVRTRLSVQIEVKLDIKAR